MKIHWLQHVPFEGLGAIAHWARGYDHSLDCTRFYAGDRLPRTGDVDMLIIMGGPMGIYDEQSFPWLKEEKRFIAACVEERIPVLGICLGAQLLAACLGAAVRKNREREIGWFDIERQNNVPADVLAILPERVNVLHWHGDTFSLPLGAVLLYSSEACINQGFICCDRFVGLQFHLEVGAPELSALIEHCRHELRPARWVSEEQQLLAGGGGEQKRRSLLFSILDYLASQARNTEVNI